MALPWLQLVRLVPSILDVSRELMRRTRGAPPESANAESLNESGALAARIASLEENERRQAELVTQMAEQLAVLSRALTALHARTLWLMWGCGIAAVVAAVAIIVALAKG